MTEQEYRDSARLNASGLKELYRSPAHYKYWLENPPETTPAMEFGKAVHMSILEPTMFAEKYMCLNDAEIVSNIGGGNPRATNKYKDWKANLLLDNPGKIMLKDDDFMRALDITVAVRAHKIAGKLLAEPGEAEKSIEWEYPNWGTPMKSRLDKLTDSGIIVDVKTCQDARPTAFSRDIWNYLYHIQAGCYVQAVEETTGEICKYIFVVVEKDPPFGVAVYNLAEATIELGMSEVQRLVAEHDYCTQHNVWPAYKEELREIALPGWAQVTEVT